MKKQHCQPLLLKRMAKFLLLQMMTWNIHFYTNIDLLGAAPASIKGFQLKTISYSNIKYKWWIMFNLLSLQLRCRKWSLLSSEFGPVPPHIVVMFHHSTLIQHFKFCKKKNNQQKKIWHLMLLGFENSAFNAIEALPSSSSPWC